LFNGSGSQFLFGGGNSSGCVCGGVGSKLSYFRI